MLEGFQAGLAWIIVLRKRRAFVRRLPASTRPRWPASAARRRAADGRRRHHPSPAKIEATIRGAQIFCEMEDRGEHFGDFCWSFTDGQVVKGTGRA